MRRTLAILFVALCAVGVRAATVTSVGTGLWSDTNTWDTATVPVSGDTAVVASGHTVTFDVDQSGFAAGITLTVNGTFQASTNAGTYTLKLSGNCTVNSGGSYLVGSATTAYPTNCTYNVAINGNVSHTGAGLYGIYCTEPTYTYVKLASDAAIGATNLVVDTDVSGDLYWGNGACLVDVNDINQAKESERRTVQTTTTNTLTISSGLTAAKSAGAYIILVTRNVEIYGTTYGGTGSQYGFSSVGATASYVRASVRDLGRGLNVCYSMTVSGTVSGCNYGFLSCYSMTVSGTVSGCNYGIRSCYSTTVSGTVSGCNYGFFSCYSMTVSGAVSGCTYGLNSCYSMTVSGTVSGCNHGLSSCYSMTVSGTVSGCNHGLSSCYSMTCDWATFSDNTQDLFRSGGTAYNTTFGSTTENGQYAGLYFGLNSYFESLDHDATEGAFRAWTGGGIVDGDATVTNIQSRSYKHNCTSADYPTFMQRLYTLEPGETLRVRAYVRKDASMAYLPRIQIVDQYACPLADTNNVPLDEAIHVGDAVDEWQALEVEWTNSKTTRHPVYYRSLAKNASGNVYFEPAVIRLTESW
jgi:broad specificity polyphosphatase/5'/3'-nucleotidase SurE